jgi:hypothetical protein
MDLQWDAISLTSLLPAALKLLDPFASEFSLKLPCITGIGLFDGYLEHSSTLQRETNHMHDSISSANVPKWKHKC